MRPVSTAAVILAAGFSRRLGRPKQSVVFEGTSLLERAIRTAQAAELHPIIAVVNEPSWTDLLAPCNVIVLLNPKAEEGMSTSVVAGIHRLEQHAVTGAILMACDQPDLRPDHLRALCADRNRITGSHYANRTGVPAYFPAAIFPELLRLTGDAGARTLLQNAVSIPNDALALDIDTEEDLRRAQQQLTSGSH